METLDWAILGGCALFIAAPAVFFSEWWGRFLDKVAPVDLDDDWPGDIR